jgi:predicted adenylyl cyclase CyaB
VSLRRNLELKARCSDLEEAGARAKSMNAHDAGLEVQTDTYFRVPSGRLKLREIEGKPTVLIFYERPDSTSARLSKYHLVPVPDAAAMKALLADAFGVRGVVAKWRRIWLWHNVRIHLDDVAGLGSFIEFEAVITSEAEESAAPGQLDELSRVFAISPSDHIAASYADLLKL